MKLNFSISNIIATGFGIGKIPFAPGTFGSLLAFPIYILLTYLISKGRDGVGSIASFELINYLLVINFALFLIGIWAAEEYCLTYNKHDPKEVVIDEVVQYAYHLLDKSEPEIIDFKDAKLSEAMLHYYQSNKRISNHKVKKRYNLKLKYPNYKNGLESIINDR